MGVISACIPSIRPLVSILFRNTVHVFRVGEYGSGNKVSTSSHLSQSIWQSRAGESDIDNVSKLKDSICDPNSQKWGHEVEVSGGRRGGRGAEDEISLEAMNVPQGVIQVKNEVATLPESFEKNHSLSLRRFAPQQLREIKGFLGILRTRAGIKLFKSFLGVFIPYIVCLILTSRDWLGRYNYIIVVSAIVNHPGRALGSQIDGAFLTILGTVAGLGWGSLALYVSTFTKVVQNGYGGVLATFLVVFTASIGWLRCVFIRFYQAVISAVIAICYTCLADTSETVGWGKSIGKGLQFPRLESPSLKRDLTHQFVKLSTTARDFTIDFTFSRFRPEHVRVLRNLIQGIIMSILPIKVDTTLFEDLPAEDGKLDAINMIRRQLSEPTRQLLTAMELCIQATEATILRMAGLDPACSILQTAQSLKDSLSDLIESKERFDAVDAPLVDCEDVSTAYEKDTSAIELFLFVHPIRQAADKFEALAKQVLEMQRNSKGWRIRAPSYPWWKAMIRTNAQVRHDRGGLTAGFYFRTKKQLDRTMADLQSRVYLPAVRQELGDERQPEMSGLGEQNANRKSTVQSLRYNVWKLLHRLQDFESRFALKVTLVTTLLSIPTWLPQNRGWWNTNERWWAVVTVWLMMHPRVGGTLQDLLVRCLYTILGTTWGGLAYIAGNGNPVIFAATFMIPWLHRFTQSSHPRSGIIGYITFTVISLDIYTNGCKPSPVNISWTRGLAFVVGIVAAVIVNWICWPFIARHELRKSLSAMMLHSAVMYRGVIAKYVYYAEGEGPRPENIERSEMLEGRLREGFMRMRQLFELTRHEITRLKKQRLRGPFNTLPYSALISACKSFFEHLVQVRQSSLHFQPAMVASDPEIVESLISVRRDAVAVILMNLYTLACALRADQPVPGICRALQRLGENCSLIWKL
ncbi:MAG: hypothetical protein Q9217_006001 [Psora testacea]